MKQRWHVSIVAMVIQRWRQSQFDSFYSTYIFIKCLLYVKNPPIETFYYYVGVRDGLKLVFISLLRYHVDIYICTCILSCVANNKDKKDQIIKYCKIQYNIYTTSHFRSTFYIEYEGHIKQLPTYISNYDRAIWCYIPRGDVIRSRDYRYIWRFGDCYEDWWRICWDFRFNYIRIILDVSSTYPFHEFHNAKTLYMCAVNYFISTLNSWIF